MGEDGREVKSDPSLSVINDGEIARYNKPFLPVE
jgi:hypothetical protein